MRLKKEFQCDTGVDCDTVDTVQRKYRHNLTTSISMPYRPFHTKPYPPGNDPRLLMKSGRKLSDSRNCSRRIHISPLSATGMGARA